MIRSCRFLIQFLILIVALIIWNGNLSAIEIKDFAVQIICHIILLISLLRLLFLDKFTLPKNPMVLLAIFYGLLMILAYIFTNQILTHFEWSGNEGYPDFK